MLFVGRKGPVGQLGRWLRREESGGQEKVRIGTIYGPGGIGKTFLLDYCLQMEQHDAYDARERPGYLVLRIDGRNDLRSLERLIAYEIPASLREDQRPQKRSEPFPSLTACREALDWIAARVEARLRRDFSDSPALFERLTHLTSYGLRSQRALPMRPYDLALHELSEDELEQALTTLQKLPPYQPEMVWPWGKKARLRNRLRSDLENQLADALCMDLQALFASAKKQKKAPKQLLLIFDDYESIESLLGDFLVSYLLERLQRMSFSSLLLFVGRDNLQATHTAWGQHHRGMIGERVIELAPFQELEAMDLMRQRGLIQSDVCRRIWEETQGYPFLLDLECEDALSGGRSALGLKLFFDRLTRWMTPIQREWIVPLAFLDEITLETVSLMLPEHDADAILAWFKAEPAIRDPHAPTWQVLPFVKRRIQQCVRNDSPRTYATLTESAKKVANSTKNEV